jgi:hypothetical protein
MITISSTCGAYKSITEFVDAICKKTATIQVTLTSIAIYLTYIYSF